MIIKPLLKQIIKSNLKVFLIFTGVQSLLISILMFVYIPSMGTLTEFTGNHFFVLLAPIFTMIYTIMVGIGMIAGQVDKGSMGYILSNPVTRTQVTLTNAFFLVCSLAIMYVIIASIAVIAGAIAQPGLLDNAAILKLSAGEFSLQLAISGIVFCSSCIFNRSSRSLILGAGFPILFFAANILAGIGKELAFFRYFSLFTMIDTKSIINGQSITLSFAVLAGMAVLLYAAGIKIFKEKDLSL